MGLILAQRHLPLYIVTVPRRHIANHFLIKKFSFDKLRWLTGGYSQLFLLHSHGPNIYCLPPKILKVLAYSILYRNLKKRLTIKKARLSSGLHTRTPPIPKKSQKFQYPKNIHFSENQI